MICGSPCRSPAPPTPKPERPYCTYQRRFASTCGLKRTAVHHSLLSAVGGRLEKSTLFCHFRSRVIWSTRLVSVLAQAMIIIRAPPAPSVSMLRHTVASAYVWDRRPAHDPTIGDPAIQTSRAATSVAAAILRGDSDFHHTCRHHHRYAHIAIQLDKMFYNDAVLNIFIILLLSVGWVGMGEG